jgi:hypothetical protein
MSDVGDEATPIDQRETPRSVTPFLAAAGVALVVLVAAVVLALARPAERNVTDSDRLITAVHDFATAQTGADPALRAGAACPGFDPARSPLGPDVVGKKVEIATMKDPSIDGDRAKVAVTSKVDGREATGTWYLTRTGGVWRVCDHP